MSHVCQLLERMAKPSSSSIPFTAVADEDFKYLESDWIAEEIKCGICLFTWVNPIQLDCSHIFCRGCFEKQPEAKCAECQQVVSSVCDPHRALVNIVNSMPVKCLKKACTWYGKRQDYMKHLCSARVEELKADGDKLFEENDFEAAAKKYAEALGPTNSTISQLLHQCKEINQQAISEKETTAQLPPPPQEFPSCIQQVIKKKYSCSLCTGAKLTETTVSQHLGGARHKKALAKARSSSVQTLPLTPASCIQEQVESVKYLCSLCHVPLEDQSAVRSHLQTNPHKKKAEKPTTTAKVIIPPTTMPAAVPPPTTMPAAVPPPTTMPAAVPPPTTMPTKGHSLRVEELVRAAGELLQENKFQGAVDRYSEALELDPKNHSILCNRSMCYLRLKQHRNAQTDAYNAIDSNRHSALGYIRLAQVSMDEGNRSNAIKVLELGCPLEPQNEEIRNLLLECKESQQKKILSDNTTTKPTVEKELTALGDPDIETKGPNLFCCRLCDREIHGTHFNVDEHLEGSTHTKNAERKRFQPTTGEKVSAPKVQPKAVTTSMNLPDCILTLGPKHFRCSLCHVPLDGMPSVQQHLRGKIHKANKNMAKHEHLQDSHRSTSLSSTASGTTTKPDVMQPTTTATNYTQSPYIVTTATHKLFCQLCHVPISGSVNVAEHLQGSTHSKAEKEQQLCTAGSINATPTTHSHKQSEPLNATTTSTTGVLTTPVSLPTQSCENVHVEPPSTATTTTKPLPTHIECVGLDLYYCTRCKIPIMDIPGTIQKVLGHAQSTLHRDAHVES